MITPFQLVAMQTANPFIMLDAGDRREARVGGGRDCAWARLRRKLEAFSRPLHLLPFLRKLSKMRKSGEAGRGTVRRG